MKTVVLGDPPQLLASLVADRIRLGLDRHDEVWQGDYHMAPAPSYRHARIGARLASLFQPPAEVAGLEVSLEFNLGDRLNFRVPDLGVHRGEPEGTWLATAAIVVEVRSLDDETYEKFEFYFDHGVEEILVCDLATSTVQWFSRGDASFVKTDASIILGLTSTDVLAGIEWNS
jgi:Putative restriction endonuclease